MRSLLIAVAALAATGGPVMAEPNQTPARTQAAWLTLSAPAPREHIVFDGAAWLCQGDTCRSSQVKALPPLRSCKRLARELGTVTGFSYRGVVLSDADLAACNPVQIAKTPSAAELAAAR